MAFDYKRSFESDEWREVYTNAILAVLDDAMADLIPAHLYRLLLDVRARMEDVRRVVYGQFPLTPEEAGMTLERVLENRGKLKASI